MFLKQNTKLLTNAMLAMLFLLKYRLDNLLDKKEDYQRIFNEQYMNKANQNKIISPTDSEAAKLAHKYDQPHDTPTCVDFAASDARKALAYIRQHADQFGVRPGHLALMGFSAGARVTWNVLYDHTAESRPDVVAPIYCGIPKDSLPPIPSPSLPPLHSSTSIPNLQPTISISCGTMQRYRQSCTTSVSPLTASD